MGRERVDKESGEADGSLGAVGLRILLDERAADFGYGSDHHHTALIQIKQPHHAA